MDPAAARCESCYSELDHEVKAFRCPRCDKLLELGTAECPKCSMRFRAKTVRPADREADERMLSKLIESERGPKKDAFPATSPAPALTGEETEALSRLVRGLLELAAARAELASGAGEARERLSRLSEADAASVPADALRSELESASEELRRVADVLSRARGLSAEVAQTFTMPGPSKMAGDRAMSLAVPPVPGGGAQTEETLLEREEQVRKREEMVDRKIKAYAQKKKELDEAQTRHAPPAATPTPGGGGAVEALGARIRSVHEMVSPEGACDDAEACLSSLEGLVRDLVTSRSELEQKVSQMGEGEEEVRTLLKALDGLLGQLPPEAVERFSKTDEFKLYERVLDRLKI